MTDHPTDQQLKSAASRRTVPLHSAVAPGLRRYLNKVERKECELVFPRQVEDADTAQILPSRHGARVYLRKTCEIEDRRVVLHSLRHTVRRQVQEAGAPDSLVADLLGLAGQGETNGTYGEAATVQRMTEWIERFPLQSILARDYSLVRLH